MGRVTAKMTEAFVRSIIEERNEKLLDEARAVADGLPPDQRYVILLLAAILEKP